MPIAATGDLIAEADARQRAVAAFNVITLEHAEAVAEGAEAAGSPVILQISENAVAYHRGRPAPLARAAAEVAAQAAVPVSLHLDHVQSTELLHRAADCGFSSAMFDAARLPYAENLAATRAAVVWAHERGLWLEAELGQVGGKNGEPPLDAHAPGARTDPEEARSFVAATGVDALAVAVGTSHAMTSRDAVIDHALLSGLREAVPVPLVLHGSSGASDEELSRAVTGGIRKVNIGTALNIAMTGAIRERLARDERSVDPRRYLADGRDAMAATVARMISLLPSGRAHAA
ncbi:class II fructose-bisphosphate aldolase family protein [Streptomyces californicus]|uniref:Class II fructose-bisphosphate aldolase family protein n=1 Tax=Streptomyces californicus TaxID=67351 RepID=A0ABD7CQW4_9ACTN|nr:MULTISPECIES: class II fructose-bisphosphate aldolase [Streptomyces]KOU11282.1 fructose-bisphosphate aldolase [Streptomyces sp. NRRL F-2295]QRV31729.1 class II fructose-bisphosphate aldolase family protein [Streptomyces californicus]QRV32661.1 class II fructose-bisphosphate aldolase family protein [Streptomyces californicus]QRV45145.1 class II fructose-bisphosphate aldolase family protein [Streptomyces californicus]QRV51835.1 class II fructose-bisphosphate aldolase family protein [Streptomy